MVDALGTLIYISIGIGILAAVTSPTSRKEHPVQCAVVVGAWPFLILAALVCGFFGGPAEDTDK